MSEDLFLRGFVKPTEVKRMNARERCTLTDILYGIPDKNLHALFAPSNTYPIGYRFSSKGLYEVFEVFNCEKLIRGCGCRDSNYVNYDFDTTECISIVSGCSIRHQNNKRFAIQIFQNGEFQVLSIDEDFYWNLRRKLYLESLINIFIENFDKLLRSVPFDFQFDLPRGCVACNWINQGKRSENVTISHTLLKSFAEGIN
ncbi:unnamed protein product [Cercopithifilaria johnstoni]|uniref:Uncharacterized protein n=1 Tax=Cercopithifilaria johnstoni TaxID=2874296 RepID=A0A8J2Q8T7_9BILA|nr:unnamed protein product [Cercopithifilaria johnstoni]